MNRDEAMEEREALKRVMRGDIDTYRVIVERYKERAYYTALGFLGNPEDALDISQDAFVRAYKSLKTFNLSRPFFPWFYKILRNLCFDFLKKRRRIPEVPLEDVEKRGDGYGVEEIYKRKVLKEKVWEAISQLSPEEREIILLRFFQDCSYKEISEILDCPIGTVMSRLYYAKNSLRKRLKGVI